MNANKSSIEINKVLKYGTPLHSKVLKALEARLTLSKRKMRLRSESLKEIDDTFRAYVKKTDDDKKRENKRKDGKPEYTTLVIPLSYALLMTAHTYWASVFLGRDVIFQYAGRHGEAKLNVAKLEALIGYQMRTGKNIPALYTWLLDVGKYGIGIIGKYWKEEKITVSKFEMEEDVIGGGKPKKVRKTAEISGYTGHKLFNIHPSQFFPDPRVPISRFQEGEFCARYFEEPWVRVEEKALDEKYFNVEVVKKKLRGTSRNAGSNDWESLIETTGNDPDHIMPDASEYPNSDLDEVGYLEAYEMTVELIPEKWGLSDEKRPQKWVFGFVPNGAIFKCRPLGTFANRFEMEILEYELDGYSLHKRGLIELAKPFQDTIDWLLNSHYYNVRKNLNGSIVYDPTKVDERSLLDPAPGKRIKLKPAAYGSDIRSFLHQFTETDHTKSNLGDIDLIKSMSQWMLGLNDNLMGQVNNGGRKTATEIRTSTTMGINRQKNHSEIFSASGWGMLSMSMVQNTQQYYDEAIKLKIADNLGDIHNAQAEEITPEDIAGFYDFIPVDGTLPVDRQAQAIVFKEMLQAMGSMPPEVAQEFDIGKIFAHTLSLAGAIEVDQFKIQILPDQQVAQQAQSGQLQPATKIPLDPQGRPIVNSGQGNIPL